MMNERADPETPMARIAAGKCVLRPGSEWSIMKERERYSGGKRHEPVYDFFACCHLSGAG